MCRLQDANRNRYVPISMSRTQFKSALEEMKAESEGSTSAKKRQRSKKGDEPIEKQVRTSLSTKVKVVIHARDIPTLLVSFHC
jgi:hypothetical protein